MIKLPFLAAQWNGTEPEQFREAEKSQIKPNWPSRKTTLVQFLNYSLQSHAERNGHFKCRPAEKTIDMTNQINDSTDLLSFFLPLLSVLCLCFCPHFFIAALHSDAHWLFKWIFYVRVDLIHTHASKCMDVFLFLFLSFSFLWSKKNWKWSKHKHKHKPRANSVNKCSTSTSIIRIRLIL